MSNQPVTNYEDIDSAMILNGSYSDRELLVIREMLDNLISE